jgi:hypothetical protein
MPIGVRIEESWPTFRPYRWLVERFHRGMIHREISRVLVLHLLWQRRGARSTTKEKCALTTPSLLSRGTLVSVLAGQFRKWYFLIDGRHQEETERKDRAIVHGIVRRGGTGLDYALTPIPCVGTGAVKLLSLAIRMAPRLSAAVGATDPGLRHPARDQVAHVQVGDARAVASRSRGRPIFSLSSLILHDHDEGRAKPTVRRGA